MDLQSYATESKRLDKTNSLAPQTDFDQESLFTYVQNNTRLPSMKSRRYGEQAHQKHGTRLSRNIVLLTTHPDLKLAYRERSRGRTTEAISLYSLSKVTRVAAERLQRGPAAC